jgi:hypothetical protein
MFNLDSITYGAEFRPPRIVLLGVEKIGKSTFAAGAESGDGRVPIFIPIVGEEGIDALEVNKFPTCRSYADVESCLVTLYKEQHNYGMTVIDSASALEPLIWARVCEIEKVESIEKVGGGYAKGYTEALYLWRRMTEGLDALRTYRNMASIIIGHVKIKRFDDPCGDSYDTYQFDLHGGAANLLYRWADVILFANTKVFVRKEDVGFGKEKHRGIEISDGARFLYTQKRPSHPGGGRGLFGQLPYELPLSWQNFIDAVSAVSNAGE